ncbi:hypothetical protein [Actinomadura chokoriensis]|uniref:Uncharacterized protein n=1 Tax=Actinomadura chokoriensis TaxID=454156 RepID=A0ABV4RAL6_9ACTN
MPTRWNYLVSETLFASELVATGVRRLCAVPIRDDDWPVGHAQMYPLHVGLHAYTSGLERLCKLTIACHGFVTDGTFPPLRPFGHKIGELLDAVEKLDFSTGPALHKAPAVRPADYLDPALTDMIERFANGAGRYEHLDSLWNERAAVATLKSWGQLCADATLSDRVHHLLSIRVAVIHAVRTLCTNGDLEASAFAILDPVDLFLSERSIAVALHLYQKASWVASTLDAVTYYTHQGLPLLGEAVQDIVAAPESFFQYSVAQIEDEQVTLVELEEHYKHHKDLDDDW